MLAATCLVLLQHLLLFQCLHSVDLSCVGLLNDSHLETHVGSTLDDGSSPAERTSPKAPLPMTFTVRKSSNPSFVLRRRRNADSRLPSCCSCRCLRSSVIEGSAASFRSSSTRLQFCSISASTAHDSMHLPCIAFDSSIHGYLVKVFQLELGCFSLRYRVV